MRTIAAVFVVTGAVLVGAQAPPPAIPPRPPLPGQTGPRDTAASTAAGLSRIRGRVLTTDSTPLRNAQITLTGGPFTIREPRAATTDQQGRYEVTDLPAGRFTLSASKAGYLTLAYGQRRPRESGSPVEVGRDQTIDNIDFGLPKASAITVRVTNEFGEPVTGVTISAHRFGYSGGERRLVTAGGRTPFGQTDDLGELRIHSLPPGDYYISAGLRLGAGAFSTGRVDRVYAETYYPGTVSTADARAISLGVGEETSVSFALLTSRPARIAGTVRAADGSPIGEARLTLDSRELPLRPDGSFVATGVAAGEHSLSVSDAGRAPPPGTPRLFGGRTFTVANDDLTAIDVTALRSANVRGRLVFDSGPPQGLRPGSINLSASPSPGNGSFPGVRWDADWSFQVNDAAGQFLFRISEQSGGFVLKSVLYGGRDVTDTYIDVDASRPAGDLQVVVTNRVTDLDGRVTDASNRDVHEYVAVVFPENRSQWTPQSRFIRTGRPDQQSRFRVVGLPPGQYLVAAVEYLEPGEERYPALLDRLAKTATPVQLVEGERRAVTLRISDR